MSKSKLLVGEVVKYVKEISIDSKKESDYDNPDIVVVKLDNREVKIHKNGVIEILSEPDSEPVNVKFATLDVLF